MKSMPPALMTLPEAADYLAMPLATLKYHVYRTRSIPSVSIRLHGKSRGVRRIKVSDLDRLIESGYRPAEAIEGGS